VGERGGEHVGEAAAEPIDVLGAGKVLEREDGDLALAVRRRRRTGAAHCADEPGGSHEEGDDGRGGRPEESRPSGGGQKSRGRLIDDLLADLECGDHFAGG
jgi:hypothetical protein